MWRVSLPQIIDPQEQGEILQGLWGVARSGTFLSVGWQKKGENVLLMLLLLCL